MIAASDTETQSMNIIWTLYFVPRYFSYIRKLHNFIYVYIYIYIYIYNIYNIINIINISCVD